jgi:hypothetical protein
MHSSGKGTLYFSSKPALVGASCICGRVGYVPWLLFTYTMPVALCYNHLDLSSTRSILLESV